LSGQEKSAAEALETIFRQERANQREQQKEAGKIVGYLLKDGRYDVLEQMGERDHETLEETKKALATIKDFVGKYRISDKGRTLSVLTLMNECQEADSFSKILQKTAEKLHGYDRILEQVSPHSMPDGLRASIGME